VVKQCLLERLGPVPCQRTTNPFRAKPDLLDKGVKNALGPAKGLRAVVRQQRTIEHERLARGNGYRVLEGCVATGVLSRLEVSKAIQKAVVEGGIVEQTGDADVKAPTARDQLIAQPTRVRIGIRPLHAAVIGTPSIYCI
jgi:hypothetical protein